MTGKIVPKLAGVILHNIDLEGSNEFEEPSRNLDISLGKGNVYKYHVNIGESLS